MRCIELLLLLLVSAWPAAFASEGPGCTLVRSMADTFSGADVGSTWGQLLLMGIDFADAKRGVAAGFNDPTEIRFNGRFSGLLGWTEDGGRTFTVSKVGGRGQSKGPLWTVRHASGDTFWAAGYGGLVMRSDDAGRTWKEHHCGRGYPSVQADFRDADHGLLAMGDNGILFATDDGGKSFRKIATPAKDVRAVAMGTGAFGVAAGSDGDLLITSDGGSIWAYPDGWRLPGEKGREKNKLGTWFRAAAAVGDNCAWVVGDTGTVLRTADAGKTFEVITIPGGEFLTAVRFADADRGWALGWHFVYRTEDGGKTWQHQPTAGGTNLNGLAVLDANTAWIAGHYGCVQQTTDGGKTWATLNDYSDLYAVAMVSDKVGFAGAESGAILRTDDGGRTWRFLNVPRGKSIEAIHFIDADAGWAVGDWGHIVRTTDGGQTWTACSSGFNDILKDVHFFDREHGIAAGARGTILLTDDGGNTWQPAASPTSRMLYAVDFTSPLTGYACGKGVLLKTADGGKSWIEIKNPSFRDDIFSDIRFANERLGLMVGDYGMIYRTEDGGRSWRALPQQELLRTPPEISMRVLAPPVNAPLHRIDVADVNTFYIAGSRGTILRSTDGGLTWDSIKAAAPNNVYAISRGVAVGPTGDPRKEGNWGLPYENFNPPFTKGSFAVWKNGTFKIKVDGVTKVKSVRIIGGPPDAKPPQFSTSSGKNSLTVKIKGKDPLLHPMLVFEAE
ncbi:MAG TPA: YCF48-related protein [Planctomycetota bacterium]|nr:YCF48-related protein [Planctomycetota bacterium]